MPAREALHKLKGYVRFLKESDFIVLDQAPERPESDSQAMSEKNAAALGDIAAEIDVCVRCRLAEGRTNTVPGAGSPIASLVFVGEAPGFHEDRQGLPFVGKAGKLLEKLLAGIGLSREDVFICNVCKCRPPNNRDPRPDEIEACEPYLLRQLDVLKPKVICALGRYAAQTLLRTNTGINRLRGSFYEYHGVALLPTLHPAAVLRNANQLADVEDDFEMIARKLWELEA